MMSTGNVHPGVVESFGREWERFDQGELSNAERQRIFDDYFQIFPWDRLGRTCVGFDAGCGSGRWALLVAPRVGQLHCIDVSSRALKVAQANLVRQGNCIFHHAPIHAIPLADGTCDFGYSLGVLHHLPDSVAGLRECVRKLKPGAPFLVYLYYAFDNRPAWYRALWKLSDCVRNVISRTPYVIRHAIAEGVAAAVYWPLARIAALAERAGVAVDALPLSYYRDKSFYCMRTDSLDRFGTVFERRFTRKQIKQMLETSGLRDIRFSERSPYWCAVGIADASRNDS